MAWIYLAESAESASPWRPGSDRSPTVKATATLNQFCYQGWPSLICHAHPSGTMSGLCEPECYRDLPMSSMGGSPAKTSVLREMEQAWQASEADLYSTCSASLASADPPSRSWKTFQLSLFGGLTEFSWSSMRWGMTRDGLLFQPRKWEPRTYESESGFLPTPMANEGGTNNNGTRDGVTEYATKGAPSLGYMARHNLWPTPTAQDAANNGGPSQHGRNTAPLNAQVGGPLNPTWVEWLMGYPCGWTELEGWATQWFRPPRGKRSAAS